MAFFRPTILKRLHRREEFDSPDDHEDFLEKLKAMIDRGVVESVPVVKHRSSLDAEVWFRDRRSGAVYRYTPPEWPSAGHWGPVEEPARPSLLESLCGELYPSEGQYEALIAALDGAWSRGEIVVAEPSPQTRLVQVYVHHPASDETYHLILKNEYQPGGSWMKTGHAAKDGTWPGALVVGPPPWRRGVGDGAGGGR